MSAFLPPGLSPWEVIAFSAICAMCGLGIASSIGVTVAYLATLRLRTAEQPVPARAVQPQPQPTGTVPVFPTAPGVV